MTYCSILLAKEQTWTTTTFDYYWNILLRRNIYREPISFTPFDIRVGQLTYGGSDYWDTSLFETELGTRLPVVLDSTTSTFYTINSVENRKTLFLEVDFLRINATNYLYHQNVIDLQFGLGYSRMSGTSNSELPKTGAWTNQLPFGNTRGSFGFRPIINTFNFNTSLTFQPTNFLMGYAYHAIGYSTGTLYQSTGGDYYLEGEGVSEAFALGLRTVYHPKNKPFSFVYGIEGRWHRTKFLTVDDPSHISHITGLDLYAKGLFITLGTIFGGKRTSGDQGFTHLLNQRYEEASSKFEKFIGDYPDHSRRGKAEEMLEFSDIQIPFQQFREGMESLKDKDLDTAAGLFSKASEIADEDLLFEINSRKKDLAMFLIDSVALHKSEMTFRQAEDIIKKAHRIAPEYPLVEDALAELFLEKGNVLFQHKSFDRAYTYYKKALKVSIESKSIVKKKYNDLVVGLMDEANLFMEQEEYISAIQSLEMIIDIHPIRQDDLGPIIEDLSSKLAEIEATETTQKMKEIIQVKQKEINDKSRYLLLLGMTLTQVMEITGEPTFTDKIDRSGHLYEMWSFDDHPKAKRLYFEDNLLVKIEK